jgi:SAM-dependent methyltransferase
MDGMELYNIAERYIELVNPSSVDKIMKIGEALHLGPDTRVIDYGCGFGEPLALWAEGYGISGVGIDIRERACERARQKMVERGLTDRIEIVCGKGAEYPIDEPFDVATCIGASFVFGGYRETIQAMREVIAEGGRMAIGEPYWLKEGVPVEYCEGEAKGVHFEHDLLAITREEGYDWEFMVRASHDDWDGYEAGNWRGLVWWLDHNADHPDRQQVIERLRQNQDDYIRYGREYLGWAIYVLHPAAS